MRQSLLSCLLFTLFLAPCCWAAPCRPSPTSSPSPSPSFAVTECRDTSLVDAFDSALAITKSNGSYAAIFPSTEGQFVPLDCAADPSLFPFPNPTPGSLLAEVLSRGVIRSAISVPDPQQEQLVALMIAIIADHYGVPLVNEAVVVPDNNSTLAIEMVINGAVDFAGPNFSPGGQFLGLARKRVLQLSCNLVDFLAAFTVVDNSSLTSFESIQSAPSLTTITSGQGSATIYASILPNLTVIFLPDVSDAETVEALRNGTIDVIIDTDTAFLASEGIDTTGLRTIFGGFDSPRASLFAIICKNEQ